MDHIQRYQKSGRSSNVEERPLMAHSCRADLLRSCPLLGVKRTRRRDHAMSANDPKRTWREVNDSDDDGGGSGGDRSIALNWVRSDRCIHVFAGPNSLDWPS